MSPRTQERGAERVQLPPDYDFRAATEHALALAEGDPPPYLKIFSLLASMPDLATDLLDRFGCGEMTEAQLSAIARSERTGCSYKQLRYIAYLADFSADESEVFYQYAESIPLSGRHCGHLVRELRARKAVAFSS